MRFHDRHFLQISPQFVNQFRPNIVVVFGLETLSKAGKHVLKIISSLPTFLRGLEKKSLNGSLDLLVVQDQLAQTA